MLEHLKSFPHGELVFWFLIISLALSIVACLVDFLRRPWYIARRVSRILHRSHIRNKQGEYPILKRVRKNPNKKRELLLELDGKGLAPPDFDKHIDRWKVGLNGMVRIDFGEKANSIWIFYLPRKYVRPTIISPKDEAVGPISLQHLINLLVIGATGTGKTVAIKVVLSKIAQYRPNSQIWLLDFKKFDFRDYAGFPCYYGYTDCLQGLKDYYAAFKTQQATGIAGNSNYLVIDEWGSFIMALSKKEAEEAKSILSELLMLGRAYNFIPIIGIQRPDALYFNGGRDNFQCCISLGNLSPEGRRMVFPDSVKEEITNCKKREGHLYVDGVGLEKIRIQDVDMAALDTSIRESMSR